MDKNKVKYGLKSVYYAKGTIAADGSATYAPPVAWPGAVNLSMDAQGGMTKFRADNINYWVGQSNGGYEGDLESALIPDSFKKDILGYIEDSNGVLIEDAEAPTVPFALLFQFEGDKNATRHVLYNCTASRPSVSGKTTDEEIAPQTETASLTASSIYSDALGKNIVKAKAAPGDAPYDTWFDTVYQPAAPITPTVTHTVTQSFTNVTSSFTGETVDDGAALTATLTADMGYTLGTVTVMMGGEDVTATAYSDGTVTIANVTSDVVITASATED